jgi:outer membrane protein TolC
MDRSAWAIMLFAALFARFGPEPCAAQAPSAPKTPNQADLLPALAPINDPLDDPRHLRKVSTSVPPPRPWPLSTAPAVAGSGGQEHAPSVERRAASDAQAELMAMTMLSAPQASAPPSMSPNDPVQPLWLFEAPMASRRLAHRWVSMTATAIPVLDPAVTLGSQNAAPAPSTRYLASPEELVGKLRMAPLEPTDVGLPINLATALRLSDARPLVVAAAQASVWVAEAELTRAKVLWVPSFMVGYDYIRHDGGGPDFNKGIMTAATVNFSYAGAGFWQNVNLTDVIFAPLVARQTLNSRHADIQTAKNDVLFQTADSYFLVHQFRGMYAGALYAVERGHDLVERIAEMSKDLVPAVEIDRARNVVADLEQQATAARELWRLHSADLTQVLRLDPRTVVVPLEHDHLQLTLIDPGQSLHDLMRIAVNNRPEITSRRALVRAAEASISREKMRPLLPVFMLNGFQAAGMYLQFGMFGLGPNSSMNQWFGRDDVSLQLVWQLDGLGVGNMARIKDQRGDESRAIIDLFHWQDQVAADVTRALARIQAATAKVSQANRALRSAITTFNGNFEGLRQTTRFEDVLVLVYRPQEAVYSLELMKIALDEYFTTVAEYNRAQFELFHALGYPAAELALHRPPGEIEPVNTSRPGFLPPVGNGPPPATR